MSSTVKQSIFVVLVIMSGIGGIIWFEFFHIQPEPLEPVINTAPQAIPAETEKTESSNTSTEPSEPTPIEREQPFTLSYQEAIRQYEGRRIQFDGCTPTPPDLSIRNGAEILLDNRSAEGLEITVHEKTYQLYSSDFLPVKISASTAPATVSVHCLSNERQYYNVATISVRP